MKLQQLRYALAVAQHNLNVSEAAQVLFTSQPGVSKQIRLLEEELGVQIFIRNGKRIIAVTEPGRAVLRVAEQIIHNVHNIKKISDDFALINSGVFTIATSHSIARFVLPEIIVCFNKMFPKVSLVIKQGRPDEIGNMVMNREVDFAIVSEVGAVDGREQALLPCGMWHYNVVVPAGHPLQAKGNDITLLDLRAYPLIAYESALNAQSVVSQAFKKAELGFSAAFSAMDGEVIKNFVRLNLGVGLLENVTYEPERDGDLCFMDATHMFSAVPMQIMIRKDCYLRGFAYQFIELFAPELTREKVEQMLYTPPEVYVLDDYMI